MGELRWLCRVPRTLKEARRVLAETPREAFVRSAAHEGYRFAEAKSEHGGVALAVTKTCTTNPCEGTGGPDTLIGNASKNQIYGRSDADYIAGRAAADRLHGNRGNDEVWGEGGADFIDGGMHSDSDRLYGGSGNDTIRAVDELNGWEDYIDCGDGTDTAYVDELDVVENCETVFRTPPEEPV